MPQRYPAEFRRKAITLAEAVERWMEVAELEETTRDRYEDLIRLYILPTFGDLQVGRLDAELMDRFYAKLHRCKHLCAARPAPAPRPPGRTGRTGAPRAAPPARRRRT